jgi:hypothetical protein
VANDFPASIEHLSVDLERSRELSARLLSNLGQKIAAVRTMPAAAGCARAAGHRHPDRDLRGIPARAAVVAAAAPRDGPPVIRIAAIVAIIALLGLWAAITRRA